MRNQAVPKDPEWSILKLLNWATSYFKSHDIDSPRATAEILLAHTLKLKRIDLYIHYDKPLDSHELSDFKALMKRRINREPVAYIVGHKEFWSMDLAVTKDVLIPRPDTECIVESALNLLPENSGAVPWRIFEPGTGSGAIILALASERPGHLFFASDRSIKAIELAKKNANRHDLNGSVNFFAGDWFSSLSHNAQPFGIIISNPPYIPTLDIDRLQPEIYSYEPIPALDGGKDGLGPLRHIICSAHACLKEEGYLLLEIGYDQTDTVQKIIDECGWYTDVMFIKDYAGHNRVVRMMKKRAV
jgi:release factor glutamine methyltransferase